MEKTIINGKEVVVVPIEKWNLLTQKRLAQRQLIKDLEQEMEV